MIFSGDFLQPPLLENSLRSDFYNEKALPPLPYLGTVSLSK